MLPEPWLRGPIPDVEPLVAPVLCAFQQAREDLALHTDGLTVEQIWATPHGFGSLGFHIRHIAGSTDRLVTYLQEKQLSEDQMAALRAEKDPGASREELLKQPNKSPIPTVSGDVRLPKSNEHYLIVHEFSRGQLLGPRLAYALACHPRLQSNLRPL